MRNYSDITFKYLKKNKKRTLFTIIGIILSLSLISGVGFLGLSFNEYMYNRAIEYYGDYEFGFDKVSKENADILKNDVDLKKVGINAYEGNGSFTIEGKEQNLIYLKAEDAVYMNEVVSHKLTEGRFPANRSELMINSNAKDILDINVNDKIKLREIQYDEDGYKVLTNNYREYTVVGFIEEQFETENDTFSAITFLEELQYNKDYSVFFTVVKNRGKFDLVKEKAEKLSIDTEYMPINNELLALRGESSYDRINIVIKAIIVFVLLVIVLATIFLIYNVVNVSVAERIVQFGLLRSIGATQKQVRSLVLKEGFIMCLISVPFGVLAGFLGVWITVKLLATKITDMFGEGMLVVKFYPIIILFTAIIGIITILIASFGPARKAGMVLSIFNIIGNISEKKIKYNNGSIIKKIFGIEGWIAYKNIRKNYKRFTVTILSLSISLIMFITFTTLNMKRLDELDYIRRNSINHGVLYSHDNSEKIEEELKNIDGIGEVYIQTKRAVQFLAIDMNLISDNYKKNVSYYNEDDEFLTNIDFYGFNDTAIKALGVDSGLKDNEVILVNTITQYDENGKLQNIDITTLKEGDTFKVPVSNFKEMYEEKDFKQLSKEREEGNCVEFKVKKIITRNTFNTGYSNVFELIMNINSYKKLSDYTDEYVKFRYSNINDDKLTKYASNKVKALANKYEITFSDSNEIDKSEEQMWSVINVFVYGFIVMISLIGIVNVVNTISINILLKKKEFGTLATIGMSKSQLNKMVIFEGVLHGIIASIIGGILSFVLVLVALRIIDFGFTVSNKVYWQPFVIGFSINLLVVLIASLIPLNKLQRMSLVETIRNIE